MMLTSGRDGLRLLVNSEDRSLGSTTRTSHRWRCRSTSHTRFPRPPRDRRAAAAHTAWPLAWAAMRSRPSAIWFSSTPVGRSCNSSSPNSPSCDQPGSTRQTTRIVGPITVPVVPTTATPRFALSFCSPLATRYVCSTTETRRQQPAAGTGRSVSNRARPFPSGRQAPLASTRKLPPRLGRMNQPSCTPATFQSHVLSSTCSSPPDAGGPVERLVANSIPAAPVRVLFGSARAAALSFRREIFVHWTLFVGRTPGGRDLRCWGRRR